MPTWQDGDVTWIRGRPEWVHELLETCAQNAIAFAQAGARVAVNDINFTVKPEGSLGRQSSEGMFPDGEGVSATTTFLGGGATPLAEIVGFATNSDGMHVTRARADQQVGARRGKVDAGHPELGHAVARGWALP